MKFAKNSQWHNHRGYQTSQELHSLNSPPSSFKAGFLVKFDPPPPIPEIFAKLASKNLSRSPYFPNGHQHIREDVRTEINVRSFALFARASLKHTHFFFGRFTSCQSPFKSSTTQKGKDIWSVRAQKTFRTGQKTFVPLKVPSRDFYYLLAGGVASGVGVVTELF